MKIGILMTGRTPEDSDAFAGGYDQFFVRYLAGRGFTFETYAVLDGVLPDSPGAMEGWLITGSRHGAYEGHAWIPPLEDFLRATYAAGVPIVGVCFGHQILAQALGGVVEKFDGGWCVGTQTYRSDVFGTQNMVAWHQDQVVKRPKDAKVIGSSDFCENAFLAYGDRALTIQPHPEFDADFLGELIALRGDVLPPEQKQQAADTQFAPLTSADFADQIEAFYRAPRP